MIRVGIIGGIGSGKSFISKLFGYPVFNADDEVKYIYKKNKECFNKLKKKLPKFIKTFPIKKKSFYLKFSSQASKYAIVGMFGSFDGDRVSVSITGAANKVFSLEEVNNTSPDQLKVYDFNKLEFNAISFNSDIHASAEYRSSLIKNMLPKLINNIF